jgi:hypothetical protein
MVGWTLGDVGKTQNEFFWGKKDAKKDFMDA